MDVPVPSECEIDEFYLIALQDYDELYPISDEAYAEELQLQEILFPSSPVTVVSSESVISAASEMASSSGTTLEVEEINGVESCILEEIIVGKFCSICMDKKPSQDFFVAKSCAHSFCTDCTGKYVATKIQENISTVKCPDSSCKELISSSDCNEIVPKQVVERWENALVESLMLVSGTTLYCPFKDCSELLLNDEEMVGSAECPRCHRLFCAQCNVAWHNGLDCSEFQRLPETDRADDDISAIRLANQKEWKRCPSCLFYVEKSEGCLHITCRCAYEFCYRCGSKWSSSTHGDGCH